MRVEDLDAAALEALVEQLDAIRHDLGKYIGFETRFLGEDPAEGDLRRALKADLLTTRRDGGSTETAWDLWARLRPSVLDGDPDVVVVDDAVAALRVVDLAGPLDELRRAAILAREVSVATRSLARRGRLALDDA